MISRKTLDLSIACVLLLLTCAGGPRSSSDASTPPVGLDEAESTITAEEMYARIAALAHDSMMGRDTPSPGLEKAAAYLAAEFALFGLEPAGDDGGFLQRYPLSVRALDPVGAAAPDPPNVVAILRGSDPALRDTYVVLSAHMDHVGVGTADATGDSIYNGADDDASGTATLVEVAQAFAALSERPARSLVFLAVSGEEKGLLGSRWFTDHPTVPLGDIVANINVDMISRNAPDSIVAIGIEYSSLGPLVRRVAAENPRLGLTVVRDPWPEERFFFRSDHFNFARHEIPALFFFAGVHEDYHRPSDEVEKIDPDKAARVARLVFRTAHAIADSPEPPRWTPEGLSEVRALTR